MLRLQQRKQKLALIEQELMRECTFAPMTNTAAWEAGKTPPWERLHRHVVKMQSPIKSPQAKPSASNSPQSRETTSTGFSRIDKLYRDGVRKLQARCGKTDKNEGNARRRRFEDLQLRQCTFKPKLLRAPTEQVSSICCELFPPTVPVPVMNVATPPLGKIANSLFKRPRRKYVVYGTPVSRGGDGSPPGIFDTQTSPLRQLISFVASLEVSPLRDPSVVLPNCGSKSERSMSSTTEYGSI